MDRELFEICRVLFQSKFKKLVNLFGFIIKTYTFNSYGDFECVSLVFLMLVCLHIAHKQLEKQA